jgi:hypothetical protein
VCVSVCACVGMVSKCFSIRVSQEALKSGYSWNVGLARTICVRCIYGIFGREITEYTVIYRCYIRFWPTLLKCDKLDESSATTKNVRSLVICFSPLQQMTSFLLTSLIQIIPIPDWQYQHICFFAMFSQLSRILHTFYWQTRTPC